jgi:hypothetical protein
MGSLISSQKKKIKNKMKLTSYVGLEANEEEARTVAGGGLGGWSRWRPMKLVRAPAAPTASDTLAGCVSLEVAGVSSSSLSLSLSLSLSPPTS